jgi:hypothetical protein
MTPVTRKLALARSFTTMRYGLQTPRRPIPAALGGTVVRICAQAVFLSILSMK